MASEESVGITVSVALTLNQIAIIVAPVLFGYIVDEKGYTYAWLCIVVLLSISAVSLYRKNKKIKKVSNVNFYEENIKKCRVSDISFYLLYNQSINEIHFQ